MRKDSIGMFWDDTPPPKPEKLEVKRRPPPPIWLREDYLPGLEEARRFPVEFMSPEELHYAAIMHQWLIVDIEVFENYFLAMFTNGETGKVVYVESELSEHIGYQQTLAWILTNCTTVTFNGNNYDIPIIQAAISGVPVGQLKAMSDGIILRDDRADDWLKKFNVSPLPCDTIDLIEVAPLRGSLKVYAGRQHARKMQDLPFDPHTVLTPEQKLIVRWYCVNDTHNTLQLLKTLKENIGLRFAMSKEYGIDLRSKSDAQIAEAVLRKELSALGHRTKPPVIPPGTEYRYQVPHFIRFQTPNLQYALETIRNAPLIVSEGGSITLPKEISNLQIPFDGAVYRMGIGGLHSSEKCATHYTDTEYQLIDKDVTSYYPFIILNLGLCPGHLGRDFLTVYRNIVNRRLEAKRTGHNVVAQALKIVINGTFGKLGSKYSMLYAPDLLIQVTLTGQLSLLLFIEMLYLAGIKVVSANTDGIVIKVRKNDLMTLEKVTAQWEKATGFETEETRYLSIHSRDVNNYIAIKQKYDKTLNEWTTIPDGTKTKGAYANPWKEAKDPSMILHKNPTTTICIEAVEEFLTKGVPIESTVRSCVDIRKFVAVRTVKGGAVKVWRYDEPPPHQTRDELIKAAGMYEFRKGQYVDRNTSANQSLNIDDAYQIALERLSTPGEYEYVGKVVRWYYGKDVPGELVYATSGNRVPRSEGAVPCMVLPDNLPDNIDYDWYIAEAYSILQDIGVMEKVDG